MKRRLTASTRRKGDGYVALRPEFDSAGQGHTVESARDQLCEALELCFETAPPTEVERRLDPLITSPLGEEVG